MTATAQRSPRNGVDVPTLYATLDAAKGAPEIAQFQFRANNEWISRTHSRSVIQGLYGTGQEDSRSAVYDVLVNGTDVQVDVSTPVKPS